MKHLFVIFMRKILLTILLYVWTALSSKDVIYLLTCRKLPFQEKHVLQQASILGNLEELGVLKSSNVNLKEEQPNCESSSTEFDDTPAVVEFGAGRGYLTQMLADCYHISKIFLVERKSYKLKVVDRN